jgi:pectate lyase
MKLLLKLLFLLGFVFLQAQNYYFSTPQGFGSNTTGGGSITPITVTNWSDLRTQMQSSGAKVILVSGVITVPQGQQLRAVINNKTLVIKNLLNIFLFDCSIRN